MRAHTVVKTMRGAAPNRLIPMLNLLVPGVGLILLRRVAAGSGVGALFIGLSNFSVASYWLIPDNIPTPLGEIGLALASLTWLGAQYATAHVLRSDRSADAARSRRVILKQVQEALARGAADEAADAIAPLRPHAERDLLIAVRLAQVLSAQQDTTARGAWERVRRLDRHSIYRAQVEEQLGPRSPRHTEQMADAP